MGELDPDWDYGQHERNGAIDPTNPLRCVACNRPLASAMIQALVTPEGLLSTTGTPYPIGSNCASHIPAEYLVHLGGTR